MPTFYLKKDYLKPIGWFGEQTVPEGNDFAWLDGKFGAYGITYILAVRLEGHDFACRVRRKIWSWSWSAAMSVSRES